ncbi:phosphoglycerate mutase 2 [Pigmentiphaga litoralis]|jgi:probable phosphoglycerate mutase|uniref:histidine phosphatase family protein n=1 Tax=Pigmentiphaga litoralis TaxID=516702 RepID=UPI0016768684|nr:histidine phosphatase family protein [Pigmentiphaga litoralis]GGX28186.1 phosphoglycerate mutase 2 [Pigmentiphaga litoralis]
MTELWLIRHGVTEWNRAHRVQGMLNIALAEEGFRQAEQLAAHFREVPPQAHASYTSDLDRAHDTARPGTAQLGLPLTVEPGLRERKYGVFEGLSFPELAERFPEAADAVHHRRPDYDMMGGESLRQFQQRVVSTLTRIAAQHPGQRVLVFTHSGVIDMAYRYAMGIPVEAERRRSVPNASINRLEIDGEHWRVLGWGDVSHLANAPVEIHTA